MGGNNTTDVVELVAGGTTFCDGGHDAQIVTFPKTEKGLIQFMSGMSFPTQRDTKSIKYKLDYKRCQLQMWLATPSCD